jgi:hypothetical protein
MNKSSCSKLTIAHLSGKEHIEKFAENNFEFRTYEVKVAVFGDNFNQPPSFESEIRQDVVNILHNLEQTK